MHILPGINLQGNILNKVIDIHNIHMLYNS